jgi:hypothetical protein
MARLRESVAPNTFDEINVFSAGGWKWVVSVGFGTASSLESAVESMEGVVLPMREHTTGVGCRDDGIFVVWAGNRQSPHEVSAGGAEGHGYRGRMAIRIMVPMPQWGQRLSSFAVMASSS